MSKCRGRQCEKENLMHFRTTASAAVRGRARLPDVFCTPLPPFKERVRELYIFLFHPRKASALNYFKCKSGDLFILIWDTHVSFYLFRLYSCLCYLRSATNNVTDPRIFAQTREIAHIQAREQQPNVTTLLREPVLSHAFLIFRAPMAPFGKQLDASCKAFERSVSDLPSDTHRC